MIGPERGRYRDKVDKLLGDARRRGARRLRLDLGPADPGRLRCAHRGRAHGSGHEPDRARHRGDAHPDPASRRDGAAGAGEPGGVRRAVHARARTVAPLDRRGHARAVVRPARPPSAGLPRGAQRRARGARPRRRGERRVSRAQRHRRHRHRPDAGAPRRARAGDVADRGRAGGGHDPLDGGRARDRRSRRAAHHEGCE